MSWISDLLWYAVTQARNAWRIPVSESTPTEQEQTLIEIIGSLKAARDLLSVNPKTAASDLEAIEPRWSQTSLDYVSMGQARSATKQAAMWARSKPLDPVTAKYIEVAIVWAGGK